MNFFDQQDHARRHTRTLVLLFVLAVLAIVIAVNLAMSVISIWMHGQHFAGHHSYPKGFFFVNTLVTVGLIAGGTLIELFNLRDGGDVVARMAGGRMVAPATSDTYERRLVNVVEEMALASGIACPRVYMLDRENAINAFAAGYNANDAVVAVTHGTLVRLTRDELQGVIAHEFSHILNGDMRLNVRLLGVLFGIQMLSGFGLYLMDFSGGVFQARSRNDRSSSLQSVLWMVGGVLFVIGYIGIFCGRLIKAAVSRQREFLADASAVQFTRNLDGIGNALRKIGGLARRDGDDARIQNINAERLSHLFLSAVRPDPLAGFLATHPPLRERLQRIYGRDVGMLEVPAIEDVEDTERQEPPARLPDIPYIAAGLAATTATPSPALAGNAVQGQRSSALEQISSAPDLDKALRDPQAAIAVVYALLLDAPELQAAQQQAWSVSAPCAAQVVLLAAAIHQLPRHARLPLLDLAMPALRQLPAADRALMLANVDKLIAADHRVTLYEFVLQTVLTRRLDVRAGRAIPIRFSSLADLKNECAELFSLAAHVAAPLLQQPDEKLFARALAACPQLGMSGVALIPIPLLGFGRVKAALDRACQLALLAKPALIKALTAVADEHQTMPLALAELLRAICAAMDAPMPDAVASIYAGWGLPET